MDCNLTLSTLGHTWIFDIDGVILRHNGYKTESGDEFLPGAREFLRSLPEKDMIIFLTSRTEEYRKITEDFLRENGIRYDGIIFGAPYGERILINDDKPGGLGVSAAIRTKRDEWARISVTEDDSL